MVIFLGYKYMYYKYNCKDFVTKYIQHITFRRGTLPCKQIADSCKKDPRKHCSYKQWSKMIKLILVKV